jgi:alkylated DNA nucleotide flippase Atl1
MVRLFSESPTHPKRAQQIWQILVSKAANRQTVTYGQLAKILGFAGAGVFAQSLGHIMYFCQQNRLPPLTVLVVTEVTGLPAEGLTCDDLNADREKVFNYDWFAIVSPAPEELEIAYRTGHK